MKFASKKANVFSAKRNEIVNANLVSLRCDDLKIMQLGAKKIEHFVECRSCKAILNFYSKITSGDEYMQEKETLLKKALLAGEKNKEEQKKNEPAENGMSVDEIHQKYLEVKKDDNIWRCEFCNTHNLLPAKFTRPVSSDEYYILQANETPQEKAKPEQGNEVFTDNGDSYTLILAVDISGSMMGLNIKGVKKALESEVHRLKEKNPAVKAGIVTFESRVKVLGPFNNILEIKEKPILFDFDKLFELGQLNHQSRFDLDMNANYSHLMGIIQNLKPSGGTALGPALVCCVGIASKAGPAARILICTDGLSNEGLGNVEDKAKEEETALFYDRIGGVAKDLGISISVIALEGGACSINNLSRIVEATNGKLIRVKPDNMSEDLSKVIENEILGVQSELFCRIHKGLKFKNEDEKNLDKSGSVTHKVLGNLVPKMEIMFEYDPKSPAELKKDGIDLENLNRLPFQTTLAYTAQNGNRMLRVTTGFQEIGKNEEDANAELNIGMLAARAQYHQAVHSKKGNYDQAKMESETYMNFVSKNVVQQSTKEQARFMNWQSKNKAVESKNVKRKVRGKAVINRMDSDDEQMEYYGNMNLCEEDLDQTQKF